MLNKLVLLNIFIHANIGLKNKHKWYKILCTKCYNLHQFQFQYGAIVCTSRD